MYDKDLFRIIGRKNIHKGDVVSITYSYGGTLNPKQNTILIVDDKLNAVWYDSDPYSGQPYIILPYQVITKVIKNINVDEYLKKCELEKSLVENNLKCDII